MKTIRLAFAGTIIVGVGLCVVDGCGQLVVGFDDAGNYHAADGSVVYYGSACVGWDASHYLTEGGTACDLHDDRCEQWFAPPGWWFGYACKATELFGDAGQPLLDDGGNVLLDPDAATCTANAVSTSAYDGIPTCDPTTDASDGVCSAYWSQFLTHGRAIGRCGVFNDGVYICAATCTGSAIGIEGAMADSNAWRRVRPTDVGSIWKGRWRMTKARWVAL
jgi:hypothetical protein